nr:MAG TPA: HeH/LEM domain [Caudoviricetes sp.]
MVEAVNDKGHVIKVSKHSYESLFKPKGYMIVGENKKVEEPKEIVEDFEEVKEETELEIDTVPISEMNKEQLAEYAKEHGIDTSNARNVREARQIIQKAIRAQNV